MLLLFIIVVKTVFLLLCQTILMSYTALVMLAWFNIGGYKKRGYDKQGGHIFLT